MWMCLCVRPIFSYNLRTIHAGTSSLKKKIRIFFFYPTVIAYYNIVASHLQKKNISEPNYIECALMVYFKFLKLY